MIHADTAAVVSAAARGMVPAAVLGVEVVDAASYAAAAKGKDASASAKSALPPAALGGGSGVRLEECVIRELVHAGLLDTVDLEDFITVRPPLGPLWLILTPLFALKLTLSMHTYR